MFSSLMLLYSSYLSIFVVTILTFSTITCSENKKSVEIRFMAWYREKEEKQARHRKEEARIEMN